MIYLREDTASQEIMLGQFVDSTDGSTPETGLTIANTDIRIQKAGSATFANKNSGGATHVESGYYTATLDATDTDTPGSGLLKVAVAGALVVQREFVVLPQQVYDSMIAGSDLLQVDVASMAANTLTASALASDAVTEIQSGLATAAALATVDAVVDAILVDTAEIGAAGAGLTAIPWNAAWDAEVQSEVTDALNAYDPPTNAELTARTLAAADYATAAALATVDANVDAVLEDTGTTIPATLAGLATAAALATVDGNVDAILVDTGTTLPGQLSTIAGYLDTEIVAIQAVTNKLDTTLQADGADWQFTAAALDLAPSGGGGGAPTVQEIVDGILDEPVADHLTTGSVGDAINATDLRGRRTVVRGTAAGGGSTTSFTPSALSPAGSAENQFRGRIIVFDNDTTTAALRGQATDITASSAAALPVLTFTALTTAPAAGDTFSIL